MDVVFWGGKERQRFIRREAPHHQESIPTGINTEISEMSMYRSEFGKHGPSASSRDLARKSLGYNAFGDHGERG
jgi:hypothetical protein